MRPSAMLMDCAKLTHWKWDEQIQEMFDGERSYREWIDLDLEPEGSIGPLEEHWNDLDNLTDKTQLIHFTRRKTQPWKTGLPLLSAVNPKKKPPFLLRLLGIAPVHVKNPDPRQEKLFFNVLQQSLSDGAVSESEIQDEIERENIRPDIFEVLGSIENPAAAN